MSISTEPDAAMAAGTGKDNGESPKGYEEYGISFDSHDGGSENDARLLLQANKPTASADYTTEEN